tara:strand:- start:1572 stop:1973 length:402 start_codon:yes stop_codon:yes gene_type:complete
MNFELKVTYNNADSGETDEQVIQVSSDDEKIFVLALTCEGRPSEETFENLFKKMYDNPSMDGVNTGVLYNEIWTIMSRWAFEKLGWHDVTVDVIGLVIDGEKTKLEKQVEIGMLDNKVWSLQLSRDGFMYCYA